MEKIRQFLNKPLVFHPFLFALFPLLELISITRVEFEINQAIRSILITLFITALILLLIYRLSKNWEQAGFFTTITIFFLFYYGIFFNGFQRSRLFNNDLYYHILTLGIFLLLFIIPLRINKIKPPQFWKIPTLFLNAMAIFLIISQAASYFQLIQTYRDDPLRSWQSPHYNEPVQVNREIQTYPDIYYVILDGYGRADVLRNIYYFDNSDFLNELQERGFYIADRSRSNFNQTALSLASSLNMEYLEDLNREGLDSYNRFPLKDLIANSRVEYLLSELGYSFVTFDTGFDFTNIIDSDIHMHRYINIFKFEEVFLSFTPFRLLDYAAWNKIPLYTFQTHRSRIRDISEQLSSVPALPGPKFVFVHYLVPHPPFVFDRFGNSLNPEWSFNLFDAINFPGSRAEYIAGYTEQIQYVNKMILKVVDDILSSSENQPIIILQGDHGPRMLTDWSSPEASCTWESASVLNALLVDDSIKLYPSITPVNTFRNIFSSLSNTYFQPLEDRVFFSDFGTAYDFVDITTISEQPCQ